MKYQFQIMQVMGIPIQQIHLFADQYYWLEYFPPLASLILETSDVGSTGGGNLCKPIFWSEGEGVNPQILVGIKMQILDFAPRAQPALQGKLPGGAKVFLVSAMLRAEMMDGQVACFVSPKITYGVYEAADKELSDDREGRQKHGLPGDLRYRGQNEWAELKIIPVIQTPTSDLLAPALVKKMKITSPKDAKRLKEAKELAYKEGFYQSTMLVGDFKGKRVADANPKVREQLVEAGLAFKYAEPENKVFYLDYGEDSWRAVATGHVKNEDGKGLETYSSDTRNALLGVLDWLKQWACARTFPDRRLRRCEFEYFYTLDIRVSSKDLIDNHLAFFLYNHIALFPREYWPKSVRANGHLQLNGEKMSKSTGNFMTLDGVFEKYGADASRIAIADVGDSIQDSNFVEDVADNAMQVIAASLEWCEEMTKIQELRVEKNIFEDPLFNNEMSLLVRDARQYYEETNRKLALKSCFYDLINAEDLYRVACAAASIPSNKELVSRYIKLQALSLAPIAPHWADGLKCRKLTQFLVQPEPRYVQTMQSDVTPAEAAQFKKIAKGKQSHFDLKKPKNLTIFTIEAFPGWQTECIKILREIWASATNMRKCNDKELGSRIAKVGKMKEAIPSAQEAPS
ncbi:hypothetical protein F5X99DRAFT_408909 [Biscogniauxia marginata]|nr:hypothetical protein F5X99DRAFT_408909 [Biscogniauxia marginata]